MIVGIIGGGQLARMLALAGIPMGLRFVILDPDAEACGASLGEHLRGDYADPKALTSLMEKTDVITYEFENVPTSGIGALPSSAAIYPPVKALMVSRDRWLEKSLFRDLGIPVTPNAKVDSLDDLQRAANDLGLPAVLKTRTLGYDGKGQAVIKTPADVEPAWRALGGMPLILEKFVNFQREVSIIGVRGKNGETRFYPLSENQHQQGILRVSRCLPDDPLQSAAEAHARKIMEALDYCGVMALELFVADGTLVANEIAPRVHNTGHWTIEGAKTSQFENHLRAILGLPLGDTTATGHAVMINFIGQLPPMQQVLATSGAHFHDYNKAPKPGRKVGHATIWSPLAEGPVPVPTFDGRT